MSLGSGHSIFKKCLVLSREVIFFLNYFNSNKILFTIDSKDSTGNTRQDRPRKIPGANACSSKDEKALHE